jgi:hypothetical protein|tara:strand:+ start:143 stop:376 length:234 start_codon:yes stop_codon:yes gene_type:complete
MKKYVKRNRVYPAQHFSLRGDAYTVLEVLLMLSGNRNITHDARVIAGAGVVEARRPCFERDFAPSLKDEQTEPLVLG